MVEVAPLTAVIISVDTIHLPGTTDLVRMIGDMS